MITTLQRQYIQSSTRCLAYNKYSKNIRIIRVILIVFIRNKISHHTYIFYIYIVSYDDLFLLLIIIKYVTLQITEFHRKMSSRLEHSDTLLMLQTPLQHSPTPEMFQTYASSLSMNKGVFQSSAAPLSPCTFNLLSSFNPLGIYQ